MLCCSCSRLLPPVSPSPSSCSAAAAVADSLSVSSGKNCEPFIKHTQLSNWVKFVQVCACVCVLCVCVLSVCVCVLCVCCACVCCVCLSFGLLKNGVYEAFIVFALWRSSGARFGAASVSALEWRAPQWTGSTVPPALAHPLLQPVSSSLCLL